ncbi:hypothetical protein [Paraburkholderia nodosa]|uniref:hypothetical protein n=1 Tax=Paraburkholderia nodosa TaxID=392320 RepID=UPI00114CBD1B|nr:hypothetical protein [Paraburkholderia nodosa]
MSEIPCSLELQLRCCTSDAGALSAHAIRMCCDGFRQHVNTETRRWRFAPAVVIGPFVLLVGLTLLFAFHSWRGPTFDCFAGVLAWIVILYGLSGRMCAQRMRSANRLEAARIDAWATMLGRLTLSFRHVVELHARTMLNRLPGILCRLRGRLRLRLGLIDHTLTSSRLVPPEAAHA